ncbi:MAG: hypothetical protein KatS3mg099_097 [Candidatus Parcubacteria bacterium]|nr:MAG: hypothetical protein KatS3mg099_097 [Candidatus Parcubacteria bacterium]
MEKHPPAFTLVELIVSIAIIGLLSSIVLVLLNTTHKKARDAQRIEDMREIQKALEIYYTKHGFYPSTSGAWRGTELSGGVSCYGNHGNNAIPGLAPAYIPQIPRDPKPSTNFCYLYRSDGKDYKFLAHQTMETCNPGACPLQDPQRSSQRTSAVFSPGARNW